ncbi:peptidase, partial [Bacillus paranthracis]|nr:peptidase [Bacillus paranthracis]
EHEVGIVTFVRGIVVASTLHINADKVNTRRKKMMRKKMKRRR